MRKIRLISVAALVFISVAALQNVAGQIKKEMRDDDGFYSSQVLNDDFRQVVAVVYADVKEIKLVDNMGGADCENNTGGGQCVYQLTADIKKVYKGKIRTKKLEFYISPDAGYAKEKLLGEKVVFLNNGKDPDGKAILVTLENSTRSIEQDVLEKMRKISGK